MKCEVAQVNGRVYVTFEDCSLFTVLMNDIEDLIKSTAYAGNYEATKEYIDMLLKLRKAKKEMEESKNDQE